MSAEYTPSTEQVRKPFFLAGNADAFDRWLAAHDAEVAARALRDAANATHHTWVAVLLNERADRIEEDA